MFPSIAHPLENPTYNDLPMADLEPEAGSGLPELANYHEIKNDTGERVATS